MKRSIGTERRKHMIWRLIGMLRRCNDVQRAMGRRCATSMPMSNLEFSPLCRKGQWHCVRFYRFGGEWEAKWRKERNNYRFISLTTVCRRVYKSDMQTNVRTPIYAVRSLFVYDTSRMGSASNIIIIHRRSDTNHNAISYRFEWEKCALRNTRACGWTMSLSSMESA